MLLAKKKIFVLFIALFCAGPSVAEPVEKWADKFIGKSELIFFPPVYGEKLTLYKSFRSLWWNFLLVDSKQDLSSNLTEVCRQLTATALVDRIECGDSLAQLVPIATAWARDLPARRPAPSEKDLADSFSLALAQASLPVPRELLTVLRSDPLGSYLKLQAHALDRQPILLGRRAGFFYDPEMGRWAIPFRPNFPQSESEKTALLFNTISATLGPLNWWVVGGHASAIENRRQIDTDLTRMSTIGTFLLAAFFILILKLKRLRLLWGVPMTFVGSGVGAAATILVFGSIHGIVISFGIGIMGLLLDYTFHGAFKSKSVRVWYSNFMGLLTTLAAFFVLMFSRIPLLRELAVFSVVGLSVSFGVIFFAHRWMSPRLAVEPLPSKIGNLKWMTAVASFLALGLVGAPWVFRPAFDMRQFDYQSVKTQGGYRWLGQHVKYNRSLIEVLPEGDESALSAAQERAEWATQKNISLENMAFYLPDLTTQRTNLLSWRRAFCPPTFGMERVLQSNQVFFRPFLDSVACEKFRPVDLATPPLYLSDMKSNGRWLQLWFPQDLAQQSTIEENYPKAISFLDLVNEFPKVITDELKWMIPTCFLLIFSLLWIYYRRFLPAMAALLPFAVGLGTLAWARFFGLPFSFVSLVGVTLLLGLGVDYGIFAVDHGLFISTNPNEVREDGLTSALLFAGGTTIAGYLPLLFCGHQVLVHLGQVLALGTLGSLLGAFWATPQFMRWCVR